MKSKLHSKNIDSDASLGRHFMPHQIRWIQAEKAIHQQRQQAVALAEKSVRIGWTYADAFKNVRKRLWFANRDYLFATKDYASALEYVRQCYRFAEIFDKTRAITCHGEEQIQVNRLDGQGLPSRFTEEIKVGVIKFDNGSRIMAFSANPQAMAVYGGDVGLDEFAKHPNARLLWETAQGRVTWGYDLAIWSSHDGEDTLFNEFAREARASLGSPPPSVVGDMSGVRALSPSPLPFRTGEGSGVRELPLSPRPFRMGEGPGVRATPNSPWNLYFRVTIVDAIEMGLVEVINRTRGTRFTREQFLADCRARARLEEVFQQAYMCNPQGSATNHLVDWSVIERCRYDYKITRLHLEQAEIVQRFGAFTPYDQSSREQFIRQYIRQEFAKLFDKRRDYRLGFDVAASGHGDLSCIYIDEADGDVLWLRGLFTCRTEDWHFLSQVLRSFMRDLRSVQACGDETGLGKQICWEAARNFPWQFFPVNFSSKKHDLGFALMNQLSTSQKRFPKADQDIAADFFALRKSYAGTRWAFSEGQNTVNPNSHCDIAWAAGLATEAHVSHRPIGGAMVG
jgi:phage FluMu gp28-like protein